jgi:diaminobutyrate-2-oxoglutarate transaminase
MRGRLEAVAAELGDAVVEVRGLGPMQAIELRDGAQAAATLAAARRRGLLLLTCGLYGNVIRLLPPVTISDEDCAEGLGILEAALREASN